MRNNEKNAELVDNYFKVQDIPAPSQPTLPSTTKRTLDCKIPRIAFRIGDCFATARTPKRQTARGINTQMDARAHNSPFFLIYILHNCT